MRVLQLIDSLNPGGAEQMAVTLTNSLIGKVEFSAICVSRKEGILKSKLNSEAGFIFLDKKSSLDYKAIKKLQKYIRSNKIDILHAHGSSFFLGLLLKIYNPYVKLIWHDHYGNRVTESISSFPVLKITSHFFSGIIVVNNDLLKWARANLNCNRIIFLPNFISSQFLEQKESFADRKLNIDLVYVANLKEPKNHLNLLAAFKIVLNHSPDYVLYLIGENYRDVYFKEILEFIQNNGLQNQVKFTGKVRNVLKYLKNSKIGIISSNSEGLPMALLEYGMAGLAVVTTNVGACGEIVGENGKIVEIKNPVALAENIIYYLDNEEQREKDARQLNKVISENYSDKKVIPKIKQFYSLVKGGNR